jgi:hypothetical protein
VEVLVWWLLNSTLEVLIWVEIRLDIVLLLRRELVGRVLVELLLVLRDWIHGKHFILMVHV